MSSLMDRLLALPSSARNVAPGAFVFHRGDNVRWLHVLEAGAVQLVRHQRGGALLVLQRTGPGAILAEASVFSARYHCDAVATRPSALRRVRKADVRDRLAADRAFAEAWFAHLAGEVQASRLRAEILALRTVAERLDAWIAVHGEIPAKGEWKTLAAEIGTSPEALYREIARRRR